MKIPVLNTFEGEIFKHILQFCHKNSNNFQKQTFVEIEFMDQNQTLRIFLQAQRDYFGAHTYELLRDPGKFIHTNWTGLGGSVSSTTYDA